MRRAWLEERDYRVLEMKVAAVESNLDAELERLQACVSASA
jgi:tRNA/rRNA methyltransferase